MPFCTSCGAEVHGSFCVKCGAPAGGGGARAAGPAPVPTPAAMAAPPTPTPKRRTSPLVWILLVVVALFVLVGIGVVGIGFFAVHKVRQAGFDPALMEKNPALAVTKMLAAANPDLEVVRVDEGSGKITLRQKSSGKVATFDFEDIKRGRITFQEEGKEAVTFESRGSGDSASFEMKSGNESVRIGSDVTLPAWLPAYPGASIQGQLMRRTAQGEAGSFRFATTDPPSKVLAFYTRGLASAGLEIASDETAGSVLQASDATRKATIMAGAAGGETAVTVSFETKR